MQVGRDMNSPARGLNLRHKLDQKMRRHEETGIIKYFAE